MGHSAAEFWNRQASSGGAPKQWTEYPLVRRYINECATDSWWAYPTHGFKAGWAYKPLARGLSIGCGTGALERDLRWLRICEEVDAFDISPESIRLARERAAREEIDRVAFHVADCESFDYEREHYDAVFFNGSMHHMSDPARLLDRVLPALRGGGLVFLDDYVGPSRDEWPGEDLSLAETAYQSLPSAWRTSEHVVPPFDSTDPSEMLASSGIVAAMKDRFAIEWERPYWGNVLFPVLCHVDDTIAALPENEAILAELIAYERELVSRRAVTNPLFVFMVGRKR